MIKKNTYSFHQIDSFSIFDPPNIFIGMLKKSIFLALMGQINPSLALKYSGYF